MVLERMLMVHQALGAVLQRKHLELSTPEWKSIPWQEIPKNLKDVLVDVLVDMPGLVEAFDKMQLCTEPHRQEELRRELIQSCWEHDRQLLTWSGLLFKQANPANPPCKRPCKPQSDDIVTHVAQVHGMSLFWATSLVLYSILWTASGTETSLPERTNPIQHLRDLVGAIAILLQPASGLYGQQNAALLLEVALQYAVGLGSSLGENADLLDSLKRLKTDLGKGLENQS